MVDIIVSTQDTATPGYYKELKLHSNWGIVARHLTRPTAPTNNNEGVGGSVITPTTGTRSLSD